ncbi:rhomboid family intramembrane serine protease [Lacticaseibacillus pantheris]|uniref:Membrane-associated serine protease n=1 Tax=Lacticaseibacillus pantheris DSM 15945 = JCM 12539 = NBRC 106106 TaxID=1423783 RepID=A0A0R1U6B4_9LACO|nr:rhomboid family intramembrane serine protease [Lacticaseibacillus pantheris]KRL86851.1 Membrane-associated serine protease [Lacticaseibacillus pantheris DSM 15945 = JCM 12539 = NBRC 106106]
MRNSRFNGAWRNQPFVTYTLLVITIGMFVLETTMGGSTSTKVLVTLGARFNPYIVLFDQWWRLVTPIFLHIGIVHLLVNMMSLWWLGRMTETVFGHWRFLTIYLISGIVGNIGGMIFDGANTVGAGASTSLFGLLGAFLMLGDNFRHNPAINAAVRQFVIIVVINLVFDLTQPTIDIAGHIAGLIGGFLIAGAVGSPRVGTIAPAKRVLMGVLLVVVPVAMFLIDGSRIL